MIRPNYNLATLAVFILLFPMAINANDFTDKQLYGVTSHARYLTGDYRASTHPSFIKLEGIDQVNPQRTLWLRKEAAAALMKMQRAFKKTHPHTPFTLVSTVRSFSYQRNIWERKWKRYNKITNDKKRLLKILEFSALPGVSRHHWGTEFDLSPLKNNYYMSGNGKILYDWLVRNAADYGFCQPYTAGRNSGHKEERWHWSYAPLSKLFYHGWLQLFSDAKADIIKSEYISRYPDTATLYMRSIAEQCK